MSANYFICTRSQATRLKCTKPNQHIPDFIQEQKDLQPDRPAVGFYLPGTSTSDPWDHRILTFRHVWQGTVNAADALHRQLSDLPAGQTVALLAPSSAGFLFTWLALMRLGHPVLLIAPQCTPSAVAHLCKACDVKILLYDHVYEELAINASREANKLGFSLEQQWMPLQSEVQALDLVSRSLPQLPPTIHSTTTDVAYFHHTSGTSTGIPKPIPQTHRAALGGLPRIDGSSSATFTTNPLYHGDAADVFRAWTSSALIWLFPAKDRPITAANVGVCLDIAARARNVPGVKYFSLVPYVVQMMAEDEKGLAYLQSMSIVGVGGVGDADFPVAVGDDLVQRGVNLILRFGSVECGFLMSSHRDYEHDKEWQYLRPGEGVDHLKFERRDDGLFELVVQAGWSHMAKANREDGSFATADLFVPHPSISNAWKYHSRADSHLTLITDKKFDPAPLEAAIAASSPAISDVLVFGSGRPYPGALLFRSVAGMSLSDDELTAHVVPVVEKMNKDSRSQTMLAVNMLLPMPFELQGLEKSSKGTILRSKAEERYAKTIDAAYAGSLPEGGEDVSDADLTYAVLSIVNKIVSIKQFSTEQLSPDTDLFAYGIDPIAAVHIRQEISRLLPKNASQLPLSVVQDAGTVANLSNLLFRIRHSKSISPTTDPHQLMKELVKNYSFVPPISSPLRSGTTDEIFPSSNPPTSPPTFSSITLPYRTNTAAQPSTGETILLTGSTGFLGAHILSLLLSQPPPKIKHIYLLARDASLPAATERVHKSLSSRQLPIPANFKDKVTILPCRLQDPDLGLSQPDLRQLRSEVSAVLHLAWDANFLLDLQQFEKIHLAGLSHLLNLASTSTCPTPPHFIFCSSTTSVSSHPTPIPEKILPLPSAAGPTGYARSKWVAEQICATAATAADGSSSPLRDRISIVRVGQLSAASTTGVWDASDTYALLLSSLNVTGCLPDLDAARRVQTNGRAREELAWLPVDDAARAFLSLALEPDKATKAELFGTDRAVPPPAAAAAVKVYHLLGPTRPNIKTWSHLLVPLKMTEGVNVVAVEDWLEKLDRLRAEKGPDAHPSLKCMDFWREAYTTLPSAAASASTDASTDASGNADGNGESSDEHDFEVWEDRVRRLERVATMERLAVSAGFEMRRTLERMPGLKDAAEVSGGYVLKLWKWVKENI